MGRMRRTAVVLGAAAATVLGMLGPVPTAGAAPPAPAGADKPRLGGPTQQVTLITGDRVLVRPGGQVDVRPGPGRDGMTFLRQDRDKHIVVLPGDATSAVREGRLDRRLFDVTLLLASGYSDARRDDIPLLLTHAAGAGPAATARGAGGADVRTLAGGRVTALSAPKTGGDRLWTSLTSARSAATTKVWLDGRVSANLDRSVPQIGAPAAWAAGHTGAGTTVAVLDTGIDTDHPDFAGAVTGSADFTDNPAGVEDGHGHGTHVASTVTGSGAASAGRYKGVAPDTKLLVGKVLDDFGGGYESGIIAGMEWAAAQDADIVNMSLGSSFASDGTDPMSTELNRLTRETGTLFVVAAGNSGPSDGSIGSPAAADEALTVGAVDATDALAWFSSRGPRAGDSAIKPEITAPGVDIVAARATGSTLGEPVGADYQTLSGTSMATPHVAGAAAILAGQHPTWTPAQLKAVLMASAKPTPGEDVFAQGTGRVDVARADTQTAYTTPATVNGGVALWPHADDAPIVRTVTYRNAGTAALTLDLTTDLKGPGGVAAPAGMVALSAGTVTVPAGGTAAVTVTLRTSVAGPDGRYSGLLVGTGRDGRTVVRTAVAVDREVESYDVAVTVRDRTGAATPNYSLWFLKLDGSLERTPYDEDGTFTARLPKGEYFLDAWQQPADGGFELTNLFEPTFVVDGPEKLDFDGRKGVSPVLKTERPAKPGLAILSYDRTTENFGIGLLLFAPDFDEVFVVPSTTSAPAEEFRFGIQGVLARPDAAGGFRGSPYQYHVGWDTYGTVPANLTRSFRDRDLGTARTTVDGADPTVRGIKDGVAEFTLPAVLTELYSPGFDWYGDVALYAGDPAETFPAAAWYDEEPKQYAAGSRTVARWGDAVVGPRIPPTPEFWFPPAARQGDDLLVNLPLHADAAGHTGYADGTGSSTLYRNGKVFATDPFPGGGIWTVPPEAATYRMETSVTGAGTAGVSTTVKAAWTFRSATAGDELVPLPVLTVNFAAPVDSRNTARAGLPFVVPVRVGTQEGAAYGRVRTPVVDVSYDEGKTWKRAPVLANTVLLWHPSGAKSVSFRATASDTAGNKVEQTIIRAYLLR